MRSLLGDFLSLEGHCIQVFPQPTAVLSELESAEVPVDLVISDVNMPQMSGFEFVEKFHVLRPKTPVILISAFGNDRTARAAAKVGAFAYLDKPFKLSALKDAISTALGIVA